MHESLAARPALLVAALSLLTSCSGTSGSRAADLPFRLIDGEPMYDVLPRDGIPSIDEPVHVSADVADAFMLPDEPVLGFVGQDGTAVAWSAWHLEQHEVVNDVVDGVAIAATW